MKHRNDNDNKTMSLMDLQQVLGERIMMHHECKELNADARTRDLEQSKVICAFAKQMINNADIILRTTKMSVELNVTASDIQELIK